MAEICNQGKRKCDMILPSEQLLHKKIVDY